MTQPRYRDARVGGCTEVLVSQDDVGVTRLRSPEALQPFANRLTDYLHDWAQRAPDRVLVARRVNGGDWRTLTYRQMLDRAQWIGQALLDQGLGPERPLAILSGNDLEHLSLALGAMWVGVPYVPVSTAYSLVSKDFGKLRHILSKVAPAMVFASGPEYAQAIRACVDRDVSIVLTEGRVEGVIVQPFERLLEATPGAGLEAAHARTGPDTIVKFLFTSGSTREPKGVITTHRMICANQQMIRQCLGFLADEPPVLVDWLPWNHVFGGTHNVGIVLVNGGTLYIDDGKPTPAGIAQTLRNLREISPTIYFNVPKGLEEIALAMDHDTRLRDTLFARCKAMMFAGAGLSQGVWDRLDAHAQAAVGERVRIITGLGMTETAPSCTFAVGTSVGSGHIGLPVPGVQTKLVPVEGKLEIRFKGPNVMPGYWRAPEHSAQAFDEEGFYRTGDAVRWVDPDVPARGLRFDGRIAEDFKLSTGTFVSVGPLRARIILAADPCVQDAVITGLNRDEVGTLIFPRLEACRSLTGLPERAPAAQVLAHPAVRAFFQQLLNRLAREATGSANRIARMHLMAEAPSIDRGEVTDKGSINQRAVLACRADLVERLHTVARDDPFVITPTQS